VVDRTALILDIFAQHARSKEGKAQVELAQLQYLLPRLRGWVAPCPARPVVKPAAQVVVWSAWSGETKLETDRRRIHKRISKLRKEIVQWARFVRSSVAGERRTQYPAWRSPDIPMRVNPACSMRLPTRVVSWKTRSLPRWTHDSSVHHANRVTSTPLTDTVGFVSPSTAINSSRRSGHS